MEGVIMSKKYYSLIIRSPRAKWGVQFGDYDRSVVAEELRDMKEGHGWERGTQSKIITTSGKQKDIDAEVVLLNAASEALEQERPVLNATAHTFLTDQGAAVLVEKADADFDDGDPENGPGHGGHPEYDHYVTDGAEIYIDWRGMHICPIEIDPPDFV